MRQSVVFYHNREEIEELAAALEALTQLLYHPDVRAGDSRRNRVQESMANLDEFLRDLIREADEQDLEGGEPGDVALDRDAVRFLAYGILHTFKAVKDGEEETVYGEEPHHQLSGLYSGFWFLTEGWESERREEVYRRIEQRLKQMDEAERRERVVSKLFAGLPLPPEWQTDAPVPEE